MQKEVSETELHDKIAAIIPIGFQVSTISKRLFFVQNRRGTFQIKRDTLVQNPLIYSLEHMKLAEQEGHVKLLEHPVTYRENMAVFIAPVNHPLEGGRIICEEKGKDYHNIFILKELPTNPQEYLAP